jgi:hypothetical protein
MAEGDAAMGEEGGEVMEMRFELFPARSLSLCLVEGVTNAAELREEVMKQKFEASFIDAAMVLAPCSPRCLPAAPCRYALGPSVPRRMLRSLAAVHAGGSRSAVHVRREALAHPRAALKPRSCISLQDV